MILFDTVARMHCTLESLKNGLEKNGVYPSFIDSTVQDLFYFGYIETVPETLGAALESGNYILWDIKYAPGYISRKTDPETQKIKVAAGTRRGWIYVDIPCYDSTRFHYRQYLKRKPEK